MATKILLCAVAALFQTMSAQVIGRSINGIYGNAPAYIENVVYAPYGPSNINEIYGPANPLIYDNTGNIYGPANPLAYDTIANYGLANAYEPIGNNMLTLATLSASRCGSLAIRSSSSVPVKGIYVEADNLLIEGPLSVDGQLPFLGTVALEGSLPVSGNGVVSYGSDDGNIGILKEFLPLAETLSPIALDSGPVAPGYGFVAPGYGPVAPDSGPVAPGYGYVAPGYGPVAPGYSPAAGLGPYYRVL